MIDRNIEETLNLVGVQVHGDHTVNTSSAEQIGHQLGTDAYTGFILTVLAGPSEVGDNGIDGTGRSALGCINHQQQLHQIVGTGEGALNQEDVATADTFLVRNSKLSIREFGDL